MRSHDEEREARQLALGAVFEADFGQHTAGQALERRFRDEQTAPAVAEKRTVVVLRNVSSPVVRSSVTS
jgi:hypothetical protein